TTSPASSSVLTPSSTIQQRPSTMMWKGMTTPAPSSPSSDPCPVSQSPFEMKQNCSEPASRMVCSTSDSTSAPEGPAGAGLRMAPARPTAGTSCAAAPEPSAARRRRGFSVKRFGKPAKDLLLLPPYRAARAFRYTNCGDCTMTTGTDKLVILATKGIDSELSSVAFTIALGGLTAGLKVSIFLTSAAVDLVRKRGQAMTHVPPLQPLATMIEDFQKRG